MAAGQRVTLTKVHERILNELNSFTQQNVESVASSDELLAEIVEVAQDQPDTSDISEHTTVNDLSTQFALDKQMIDSNESNRDFDPDL